MNRDSEQAPIDLGAASTETKGNFGIVDDHRTGLIPAAGLSEE